MEKVTVVYDKMGNTLDVWFGKPKKAICEEIGNGFILKKDRAPSHFFRVILANFRRISTYKSHLVPIFCVFWLHTFL